MILQKLWERNPAFYFSLYFTLGVATALKSHWIYFLPLFSLFIFSKWRWQGISVFFIAYGYTYFTQPHFPNLNEAVYGKGKFILKTISPSQTPFQHGFSMKGILREFNGDGVCFSSLPCTIFLDQKRGIPNGNSWNIEGTLSQKSTFYFIFKPNKKMPWEILDVGFSWTRWRFVQKEKIRHFFHHRIKDKPVAHFFSILATGDIDDLLLATEFQKLGLGHILAISGLHFALIALVISKIFRWFFSPTITLIMLFICLTFYCFFLGGSPSILRAFTMISLWICSLIIKREGNGLNYLGIALFLELIIHPLSLIHLGFQLTFSATLGIFLYYSFFHSLFEKLLPKRTFHTLSLFSKIEQHIYLFLHAMRAALSLNAAVTFMTLFILLYLFPSFPVLSLVYNLFIPSLLMISMLCIPLGLLIPPLENLNIYFTKFLLRLISNPPEIINYAFPIGPFSYTMLIFLLTGIFFGGCFLCAIDQKKTSLQN